MTTIAYKAGVMACDSSWTNDSGAVATLANKIFRLASGAIVGECGDNDSRAVRQLLDKIKSFDKMPMPKELAECKTDYGALIAFPNGELAEISISFNKEWRAGAWKVNRGFSAVGSGGELAIGYMGAGKTAAQAVQFSCSWDPYSSLPVHVTRLHPAKKAASSRAPGQRRRPA